MAPRLKTRMKPRKRNVADRFDKLRDPEARLPATLGRAARHRQGNFSVSGHDAFLEMAQARAAHAQL